MTREEWNRAYQLAKLDIPGAKLAFLDALEDVSKRRGGGEDVEEESKHAWELFYRLDTPLGREIQARHLKSSHRLLTNMWKMARGDDLKAATEIRGFLRSRGLDPDEEMPDLTDKEAHAVIVGENPRVLN